jgi:DNA-binding GntR family transcriptional regulator
MLYVSQAVVSDERLADNGRGIDRPRRAGATYEALPAHFAGLAAGPGLERVHERMKKLIIRPVSVIDALASSLRERILSGEIPTDTAHYQVARPTIRAVIQQLMLTGLLRREANRSAFVPRLDTHNILDLFFVRTMVETEAVRLVTSRRARPARAEQAVRSLEAFSRDAKWSDVVEADLEFHRAIVTATNSPRLLRVFALLEDEIRLSIAQLKPAYESAAALAREHRELLTAIEDGDQKTAVSVLRNHLDQAIADLTRVAAPASGRARAVR